MDVPAPPHGGTRSRRTRRRSSRRPWIEVVAELAEDDVVRRRRRRCSRCPSCCWPAGRVRSTPPAPARRNALASIVASWKRLTIWYSAQAGTYVPFGVAVVVRGAVEQRVAGRDRRRRDPSACRCGRRSAPRSACRCSRRARTGRRCGGRARLRRRRSGRRRCRRRCSRRRARPGAAAAAADEDVLAGVAAEDVRAADVEVARDGRSAGRRRCR